MTPKALSGLSVDELVEAFKNAALAMEKADKQGKIGIYNRMYFKSIQIEDELKSRPGDQRVALLALYAYPDMEVRMHAAQATCAVAPEAARQALDRIRQSNWPQAGPAGMTLRALDEGLWQPK